MASRKRTIIGIGAALVLLSLALALTVPLIVQMWGETPTAVWLARSDPHGLGLVALLPIDVVLILTLIAYALALFMPQDRVALLDNFAMGFWGICMFFGGIALFLAGLAAFIGLVTMLLAFPFGTIAYFAQYTCNTIPDILNPDEPSQLVDAVTTTVGVHCFAGVSALALFVTFLKLVALAVLLLASVGFLKVRGLLIAIALVAGLALLLVAVLRALSGLTFVLYPAEALVTAMLGLIVALYGVWVFAASLRGFARAVAAQIN